MKTFVNLKWTVLFLLGAILLTSCEAGNVTFDAEPAGFWMGLWHGFISLFTFIISLFNDKIDIYEVNNTGKLYDLGFILGILIFYGGSSKSSCMRRKF